MSKDNISKFYKSSKYTDLNPNYHLEDSPFKWKNFEKCLKNSFKKNKIEISSIESICEIGCGAGGILNQLKNSNIFHSANKIEGWDINPGAIDIAKTKFPKIVFINEDLFNTNNKYDLIICADVFEHIENPYSFLRKLKKHSNYFLFNIPLEANLLNNFRGERFFERSFNSVGHLHFYNSSNASLILKLTGYDLISRQYVTGITGNLPNRPSLKRLLISIPTFLVQIFSVRLSTILTGGHLVVLAKIDNDS